MPTGQNASQKSTSRPGLINRIYLHPVRPAEQYQVHSAVWAEYTDGRKRQLTGSTFCTAPKVFRDGRTYGWLEGAMEGRHGYLPATLVLFREGMPLCRVETEMRHTVDWCFSKDGQYAIICSMALHGPFYFQRVNLSQRKVDAKYTQYAVATANPAWVSEGEKRMSTDQDGNYRAANPVTLSLAQLRPLNETFSALAAVEMLPFVEGQLPDSSLIRFAVQHTYLNGDGLTVPTTTVDALCQRFFGKKIQKHQSVDSIRFDGRSYRWPGGDGEESSFALVEQIHLVAPTLYQILLYEYRAAGDSLQYLHTQRDQWSRLGGEQPTPTRQMRCLARKSNGPKADYIIVEYLSRAWQ